MKIEQDKVVALSYELEVEGAIADRATDAQPLEYIHGTGMLLPKFEEAVAGKEPGESFEFTLSPEEGYGEYVDKYCFDIPKSAFEIDGKVQEQFLQPGRMIPMLNAEGQVIQGIVRAVKEEAVTMDFNHPMAGKTLHFTGSVVSVRQATEKELTEGLHGEFLPPQEGGCGHCGGHCHGDGEGCGEGGCGCGKGEGEGCGCGCGEGGCNCGE